MKHELHKLPYALSALEPLISTETMQFHYGKHHKSYVDKLDELVPGTQYEHMSLDELVRKADGVVYDNAAQVWNHDFFWRCLQPPQGKANKPAAELGTAIERDFGSFADFEESFKELATGFFGSGYIWLSESNGKLRLETLPNAGNPLHSGRLPILTCDLWEHAYYIDHRNERAKFLDAFFQLANWDFARDNFFTAAARAA